MAKKKELTSNKNRGKFLTVVIILLLLLSVLDLTRIVFNFNGWLAEIAGEPDWYMYFYAISFIGEFVSLYGLWMFKKWGFYLFLLLNLIWMIYLVAFPDPLFNTSLFIVMLIFIFILIFALPLWAIRRKWHLFT